MDETEDQIRQQIMALEQLEADATLRADVAALDALWHERFIAASSANLIGRKSILLQVIRDGQLRLRSHARQVVRLVLHEQMAIATGNENSELVGVEGRLFCSYMNVWIREGEGWRMLCRHVGLIERHDPHAGEAAQS